MLVYIHMFNLFAPISVSAAYHCAAFLWTVLYEHNSQSTTTYYIIKSMRNEQQRFKNS